MIDWAANINILVKYMKYNHSIQGNALHMLYSICRPFCVILSIKFRKYNLGKDSNVDEGRWSRWYISWMVILHRVHVNTYAGVWHMFVSLLLIAKCQFTHIFHGSVCDTLALKQSYNCCGASEQPWKIWVTISQGSTGVVNIHTNAQQDVHLFYGLYCIMEYGPAWCGLQRFREWWSNYCDTLKVPPTDCSTPSYSHLSFIHDATQHNYI